MLIQKNRSASLEQEVNNLSNVRENYEMYVLKMIDQIKNNVKEAYNYIEDMENEKMVMESKYRQLNDKTILIQNKVLEVDGQKRTLEDNYNQLKSLYRSSKDEYLELKYEL